MSERLVQLENANPLPVVMPFKTKNWYQAQVEAKILVTRVDRRARFGNFEERFPLPFAIERTMHPNESTPRIPVGRADTGFWPRRGESVRTEAGLRLPPVAPNGLWPRAGIHPRFVHSRFGLDTDLAIPLPSGSSPLGLTHFCTGAAVAQARLASYHQLRMEPGREYPLRVVIPPSEFPDRGGQGVFQVDYQKGNGRPIQHLILLRW